MRVWRLPVSPFSASPRSSSRGYSERLTIHLMYTLRFPFTIPAGREIAVTDSAGELDGLKYRFVKRDRFYVLTLSGFPTAEAAQAYLKDIRACLLWVLLQTGIAADAVFELQQVAYTDDPMQAAANLSQSFNLEVEGPVDALLDGGRPAVYSCEKRVRILTGGLPSVILSTPCEVALRHLTEGLRIESGARIADNQKLLTAFDLYAAYFTESAPNARFLTLIMALETLATGVERTRLVLDLLERWRNEAENILQTVAPDSDDATSLEGIMRELLFRREDSIRRQMRNLVLTTLKMNGDGDAAEAAKAAVRLYDLRSTLVHEGTLPAQKLSESVTEAKGVVERVLRARFLLVAAGML
jgi:hypothetical protein